MIELLRRIIRLIVFLVVAFAGLVMAVILAASTLVAIVILLVVSRLRGKPFAPKEYWTASQSKRKSTSATSALNKKDVTDLDSRDLR